MPLGGIGTGTVSLGGRGDLRDWEIVNRPAKGFSPRNSFFALWCRQKGKRPVTRCLEGPLPAGQYDGAFGAGAANHGLPRFRHCQFDAAYPLAQVALRDPAVPLKVRIEAFNPLVPSDTDASSHPAAMLRLVLENTGNTPVQASVCGNVENFIGRDGSTDLSKANVNHFAKGKGFCGVMMTTGGVDRAAETWGTMALSTSSAAGVHYRTAWADRTWGDSLLDWWDDFSDDGVVEDRPIGQAQQPMASLGVKLTVPAKSRRCVTFMFTWHFPNRQTWTPAPAEPPSCGQGCDLENDPALSNTVGNYYTTRSADAWDAAAQCWQNLAKLEMQTVRFVNAFCDSDLPAVWKEAALFNLSTLRSQTVFRTADGNVFGWEGCGDKSGSCFGNCTHVWNYEMATVPLFGDLARNMRQLEFLHATDESGKMCFRLNLPLGKHKRDWNTAAADGQMGCLLKLYRQWRACGDDRWLRSLWPAAVRVLRFAWIENGWDADQDGVMEGCQHNTMDVEYYGPNPQMQGWYLAALAAMEKMARHLGDTLLADRCQVLRDSGSAFMAEKLFNGEYYEHHITPPGDASKIAPGLRHATMGATNLQEPELQLGSGCLIDQLVGLCLAYDCGLTDLLPSAQVNKTLTSIVRYNRKSPLWDHFNHLRSFALQEESALLMASYPRGRRPARPFPYFNEVMTGFEYVVAVQLLQGGQARQAQRIVADIRARYDGHKRNPFDEAECGHHYIRAMASWGAVAAACGFDYCAITGTLTLKPIPGTWFWAADGTWGTLRIKQTNGRCKAEITPLFGKLKIKNVKFASAGH